MLMTLWTLWWHFPLVADGFQMFHGMGPCSCKPCSCFSCTRTVGENEVMHCDVTFGSQHISTSMFSGCFSFHIHFQSSLNATLLHNLSGTGLKSTCDRFTIPKYNMGPEALHEPQSTHLHIALPVYIISKEKIVGIWWPATLVEVS